MWLCFARRICRAKLKIRMHPRSAPGSDVFFLRTKTYQMKI